MPAKKALIVIDFQNDFIDGALGFERAKALKERILRLVQDFDGDVIYTLDTHYENYLQGKEGRNLPVKHCIKGTLGWQMPSEFTPLLAKAKAVFEKESFGSIELASFLREQNYAQIELCGLVSHICVLHNAILAFNACKDAELILHKNATASFDESLHEQALSLLEKAFWVRLV